MLQAHSTALNSTDQMNSQSRYLPKIKTEKKMKLHILENNENDRYKINN